MTYLKGAIEYIDTSRSPFLISDYCCFSGSHVIGPALFLNFLFYPSI